MIRPNGQKKTAFGKAVQVSGRKRLLSPTHVTQNVTGARYSLIASE
jgi:hypothetical protein